MVETTPISFREAISRAAMDGASHKVEVLSARSAYSDAGMTFPEAVVNGGAVILSSSALFEINDRRRNPVVLEM